MVDAIRGAAPPDPSWFRGGPVLGPAAQIGIYQEQFRLRFLDAVRVEIPGLAHLLGEDAETLIFDYLAAHPPNCWTLNRVADPLVGWLRSRGAPTEQIEMASLDHAVSAGFEAAEGQTPRPEALAGMPALTLQPHVHLLEVRHDVHAYRSAVIAGEAGPRPPRRGPLAPGGLPARLQDAPSGRRPPCLGGSSLGLPRVSAWRARWSLPSLPSPTPQPWHRNWVGGARMYAEKGWIQLA